MLILSNWVENTFLYPPVYIYAGMAKGKAEKRAEAICEELYKINWAPGEANIIGELKDAWSKCATISKLNWDGKVRELVIEEAFDELLEIALIVNNEIKMLYKPHQDLNKWYNNVMAVSNQELKNAINGYRQTQVSTSRSVWNI